MRIGKLEDIIALEARGMDASYRERSPWEILRQQAALRPETPAIRYLRDAGDPAADEIISFGDLAKRVMGAASLFRSHGVSADRSVALLTQHTPSGQTALWGAQVAGRACPINPMLRPDHVAALIRAANCAAIVITGSNDELDYWSALVPALRSEGVQLPIFSCDSNVENPGSDGSFEKLVREADGNVESEGDENSIAAYFHTGGTTGAPKLVQHTRRNEAHVARSCALMHDFSPQTVMVNGFPLFHVAGAFVFGLSVLSAGGSLVVPGLLGMRNQTFMKSIWQQVERLGVTTIGAVPTVLAALKATPVNADISSLKWLLTGGSPLPTELADATEAHAGVPVRNILGMTESAGAIAVEPVHGNRTPLSCGLRLPFTEVAILGETDGEADPAKQLGEGETGIVATRGVHVAAGYSDPSRNAGTFHPDGWLISGDLGYIDDEGRLFVTGRKKDMIIRGAHNIDPQMIEDALLAHPSVDTAAAIGMPDAYAGELPVAFVTLNSGAGTSETDLIAFLKERIEDPVALPKRIAVVDTMPLTPIGKIFKPTLRAEAFKWAINAAADKLQIDAQIEVDDKLATTVRVPQVRVAEVKNALAGMPINLTVIAT